MRKLKLYIQYKWKFISLLFLALQLLKQHRLRLRGQLDGKLYRPNMAMYRGQTGEAAPALKHMEGGPNVSVCGYINLTAGKTSISTVHSSTYLTIQLSIREATPPDNANCEP